MAGHFGYFVEIHLRWGPDDTIGVERRQAVAFVIGNWIGHLLIVLRVAFQIITDRRGERKSLRFVPFLY